LAGETRPTGVRDFATPGSKSDVQRFPIFHTFLAGHCILHGNSESGTLSGDASICSQMQECRDSMPYGDAAEAQLCLQSVCSMPKDTQKYPTADRLRARRGLAKGDKPKIFLQLGDRPSQRQTSDAFCEVFLGHC